jgi:gliding motility-associated-like protein
MFKTSAMKGILALLFLLLLLCSSSRSQNLVPNPSFEEFEGNCPDSTGFEELKNWYSAYLTPDYFSGCNSITYLNIPTNVAGFQKPLDGLGYIGFVYYASNGSEEKEYVQVKLIDKLETGRKYKLSYYTSAANNGKFAIDQLGAWLHADSLVNSLNLFITEVTPQVCSYNDIFLTDTTYWTKVEGCFQAKGDERYLTLGNFVKNSETKFVNLTDTNGSLSCCAYYLIDMVELFRVPDCTHNIVSNIITPNSDEINDVVQFTDEQSGNCSLSIYNRWGNLVYSSTGKNLLWNGLNQQGNTLFAGVYYYVLTCGNERKNGTITLFN